MLPFVFLKLDLRVTVGAVQKLLLAPANENNSRTPLKKDLAS